MTTTTTDLYGILNGCTNFNQDVGGWNISAVTDVTNLMLGVTLSTTNYDNILVAWELLDLVNGLNVHFGSSKYTTTGQTAKNQIITDDSWSFTDGGLA